jgi:hypothetical protein
MIATLMVCSALLVPMPPVVHFAEGPPPGMPDATAATDVVNMTIYHVGPLGRFARAHEIGHLLDAQVLTDGDRRFFTRLLGLTGPWEQSDQTLLHPRSPDEWFADYYAAAAIGMRLDGSTGLQGAYADWGPKRLARFEKALDRFGNRYRLGPYRRPGRDTSAQCFRTTSRAAYTAAGARRPIRSTTRSTRY